MMNSTRKILATLDAETRATLETFAENNIVPAQHSAFWSGIAAVYLEGQAQGIRENDELRQRIRSGTEQN